MKSKGETYLPALSGQDSDRYKAYKTAALWYNATKRTIRAVKGTVLRTEPILNLPAKIEEYARDITLSGMRLLDVIEWVLLEVLIPGRGGLVVSWSGDEGRPKLVRYTAEQITNWRFRRVGDEWLLSELRLREVEKIPDTDDPFEDMDVEQYRVMTLDPEGLLVVDVYRQMKNAKGEAEWAVVEHVEPERGGMRLEFIPFVFFGPSGTQAEVEEPPFLDLADVNYDHYRLDAEHKYGLQKGAMGTVVLTGWELPGTDSSNSDGEEGVELDAKIPIGSEYALVNPNAEAKAEILEFTGQGLNPLKEEKEKDEDRMAALGARVLEEPKAGVEAAAAIQMRHSGETSVIADIVSAAEEALNKALGIFAWWDGLGEDLAFPVEELSVQLNRDFTVSHVEHQMLTAMMKGVQSGDIDEKTWFYFLQESELTIPEDTFEEFQVRREETGPRELSLADVLAGRNGSAVGEEE